MPFREFLLLAQQALACGLRRIESRHEVLPLAVQRVKAVAVGACLLARLLHRLRVRLARGRELRAVGFESFACVFRLNEPFAGGLQATRFVRHLLLDVDRLAAQALAARIRFFEPHAMHAVIGAQLSERLRQRVDGAVQVVAATIETVDARASFRDAPLQFRQVHFRLLDAFA